MMVQKKCEQKYDTRTWEHSLLKYLDTWEEKEMPGEHPNPNHEWNSRPLNLKGAELYEWICDTNILEFQGNQSTLGRQSHRDEY